MGQYEVAPGSIRRGRAVIASQDGNPAYLADRLLANRWHAVALREFSNTSLNRVHGITHHVVVGAELVKLSQMVGLEVKFLQRFRDNNNIFDESARRERRLCAPTLVHYLCECCRLVSCCKHYWLEPEDGGQITPSATTRTITTPEYEPRVLVGDRQGAVVERKPVCIHVAGQSTDELWICLHRSIICRGHSLPSSGWLM
ncbi:hypothetical protein F4818DRAFT_84835 [Hypoxylon cercidicola]|nr:hypothetical protein F4818DRAFT_84835 [Hypoxylon cercidicola]